MAVLKDFLSYLKVHLFAIGALILFIGLLIGLVGLTSPTPITFAEEKIVGAELIYGGFMFIIGLGTMILDACVSPSSKKRNIVLGIIIILVLSVIVFLMTIGFSLDQLAGAGGLIKPNFFAMRLLG